MTGNLFFIQSYAIWSQRASPDKLCMSALQGLDRGNNSRGTKFEFHEDYPWGSSQRRPFPWKLTVTLGHGFSMLMLGWLLRNQRCCGGGCRLWMAGSSLTPRKVVAGKMLKEDSSSLLTYQFWFSGKPCKTLERPYIVTAFLHTRKTSTSVRTCDCHCYVMH